MNESVENFRKRVQQPGETFDDFLDSLCEEHNYVTRSSKGCWRGTLSRTPSRYYHLEVLLIVPSGLVQVVTTHLTLVGARTAQPLVLCAVIKCQGVGHFGHVCWGGRRLYVVARSPSPPPYMSHSPACR